MLTVNPIILERVRAGLDISAAEGRVLVQELFRLKLAAARNGAEAAIQGPVVVVMERIRKSEGTVANADAKVVLDAAEELDTIISNQ